MKNFVVVIITFIVSFNVYALKFNQPKIGDGFAERAIWSIDKDSNGFLWFATSYNVLKYNGYKFQEIPLPEGIRFKKRTLHVDFTNKLWIGTEYGEIYSYFLGKISRINISDVFPNISDLKKPIEIHKINSDDNGNIFIATNKGLVIYNESTNNYALEYLKGKKIKDILVLKNNDILIGQDNNIYRIQYNKKKFKTIKMFSFNENEEIRILHETTNNQILVGTNKHLYEFDLISEAVNEIKTIGTKVILSIASNDNYIWVGTLLNGLYKIDIKNKNISNYRSSLNLKGSISDNAIVSLFLDDSGVLFAGTFYGNINITNTNSLGFNTYNMVESISCLNSKVIYSILKDEKNRLWLGTTNGLVQYSEIDETCHLYKSNSNNNSLSYPEIRSIYQGKNNQYWVSTNRGLNLLNSENNEIDRLKGGVPKKPTLFSVYLNDRTLLIGTESGLYEYNTMTKVSKMFPMNNEILKSAEYISYIKTSEGQFYFITDMGVVLIVNNQVELRRPINDLIENAVLTDIYFNEKTQTLWLSSKDNGLFGIKEFNRLVKHYKIGEKLPQNTQLQAVLEDSSGHLWVSSTNGLYHINISTNDVHLFNKSDGIQGNSFKRGSAFKGDDGKIYFGGLNGLNGFFPKEIFINNVPPKIVITNFSYFNHKVTLESDSGYTLDKPINEYKKLILTHKDYIFGFEFAALDYADSLRNKYAYRLVGLKDDWIYVDADNRKVTYTNLKPGKYSFQVKAANKDGVWNETPKILAIIVKPAPWFTWWAYLSYVLLVACVLYYFINRRIRNEQKINAYLKQQVSEKTAHISEQKKILESLMVRKNELFSNVSHEFRTPLTLILGPIDELLKQASTANSADSLNMIKRNANRLLSLVNQLLLLAQFTENKSIKKENQNVAPTIQVIVSSFEHAANAKRIELVLVDLKDGVINITPEALETCIGNFLSNAIKYTQIGGNVYVGTKIIDKEIEIYVKDTGCGFDEKQKKTIFERFKRLDHESTIEGVGIGLALVNEVAYANNAHIVVKSKIGKGSCFSIFFPLVDTVANYHRVSSSTLERLNSNLSGVENNTKTYKHAKHKETVLIIEDNNDMRAHIQNVLNDNFNCLLASGGKEGIGMALKQVPDLIICDVMMPGMDGFEVSRILRGDMISSHIPLILLTALDEKVSRIKGWRENIDMYLTKPFDADELNLQIRNILNIRSILNKKIQKQINATNHFSYEELPEIDFKFIQKLHGIIEKQYHDPLLNLAKISSSMFISERQLQRKSNALINMSPIDMLREYRLKMATELLINGCQVSIASDKCGYNSVSYFSSRFKNKYGISPKQYQKLYRKILDK